MAIPFELKKTYNFNTLAGVMLGNSYTAVKVKGIMDSGQAVQYRDILTLHTNIRNIVPNMPKSVTDLTYVLFENTDGENVLLAYEYIDTSSIVEVKTIDLDVKIYDVTTEDVAIVRKALSELGYNVNISIDNEK